MIHWIGALGARMRVWGWRRILAGLAGVWIAAHLLITPLAGEAIRAEIERVVNRNPSSPIAIVDVELGLFPWPSLTLAGISVGRSGPGAWSERLTIERVDIVPALWGLLSGTLDLDRVTVVHPVLEWEPEREGPRLPIIHHLDGESRQPQLIRVSAREGADGRSASGDSAWARGPAEASARRVGSNPAHDGDPGPSIEALLARQAPPALDQEGDAPFRTVEIGRLRIIDAALVMRREGRPWSDGFTGAEALFEGVRLRMGAQRESTIELDSGWVREGRLGRLDFSGWLHANPAANGVEARFSLQAPHFHAAAAVSGSRTEAGEQAAFRLELDFPPGGDRFLGRRGFAISLARSWRLPVLGAGQVRLSGRLVRQGGVDRLVDPQFEARWPEGMTLYDGPFTQPQNLTWFLVRLGASSVSLGGGELTAQGAGWELALVGEPDSRHRSVYPFVLNQTGFAQTLRVNWRAPGGRVRAFADGLRLGGWDLDEIGRWARAGTALEADALAALANRVIAGLQRPGRESRFALLGVEVDPRAVGSGRLEISQLVWSGGEEEAGQESPGQGSGAPARGVSGGLFHGAVQWDRHVRRLQLEGFSQREGAPREDWMVEWDDRVGRSQLSFQPQAQ